MLAAQDLCVICMQVVQLMLQHYLWGWEVIGSVMYICRFHNVQSKHGVIKVHLTYLLHGVESFLRS